MKIRIYTLVDVFYYSYYIEGFKLMCGKRNVFFSSKGFPEFPVRHFAAIIETEGRKYNLTIDAFDNSRINQQLLNWCDIYGKVNYNSLALPKTHKHKIIPIGPSFGIRIWNLPKTIFFSIVNYSRSKKRVVNIREFFANYWRQYRREPIEKYMGSSGSTSNYIYFISSLWEKERETNNNRSQFITAAKESNFVSFEGGFAARSDKNHLSYDSLIIAKISLKDYLVKIKKSLLVFNTPAVEGCHGWKLPEFMILGKAIFSTEIHNELPMPLIHGQHIHFLEPEKEIIRRKLRSLF